MTGTQSRGVGGGRGQEPPPWSVITSHLRRALPTPALCIINNHLTPEITEGRVHATWAFQGHCDHGLHSPSSPEHRGCQEVSAVTGHTLLSRTRLNMEDSGVNIHQITLRLPPSSSFLRASTFQALQALTVII